MSVTPDFVGQRYKDTNTGNIWIANSTTPGDWTLELQNAKVLWTPTSESYGELVLCNLYDSDSILSLIFQGTGMAGGLELDSCTALQTVSAPNLLSIEGLAWSALYIDNCSALTSVSFPVCSVIQDDIQISNCTNLISVDLSALASATNIFVETNDSIQSIDVASLVTVDDTLDFGANPSLVTINLPSLVSIGDTIDCSGSMTSLTTVNLPVFVPVNGNTIAFGNAALSATSVNHILARCVAAAGFTTGSVALNAGTSAAPTGQGIVDKATLTGRGVTVWTN